MKKVLVISLFSLLGLGVLIVLFFGVRQRLANLQIKAEWQAALPQAPALQATSRLEIVPLYENAPNNPELISGHGVSYLVRTDTTALLVDAGHNPDELDVSPAMQNLQTLGIPAEEIDAVLISHPHPDHMGGIPAWQEKTISFGKTYNGLSKTAVYAPIQVSYPGAQLSAEPTLLSPDIATTGLISYPEVYPISLFTPKGSEQGVIVNVNGEGLILITGCGHPTLEKLVARAEALYGLPVIGVVGGLHYGEASAAQVQPHIEFLKSRQIKLVALSPHDSGPQAIAAFQAAIPDAFQSIRLGEAIHLP